MQAALHDGSEMTWKMPGMLSATAAGRNLDLVYLYGSVTRMSRIEAWISIAT